MRSLFLSTLFFIILCHPGLAQSGGYQAIAQDAYRALQDGLPRKALKLYKTAFKLENATILDVLRATVAATEARKVYQAAEYLDRGFLENPLDLILIFNDQPEFRKYHDQPLGANIRRRAILQLRSHKNATYPSLIQDGEYQVESEEYALNVLIAGALLRTAAYEKSLDYYQRSFNISDEYLPSLLRAGMAAALTDRKEDAEKYFGRAFRIHPEYAMTFLRLHEDFEPGLNAPILLEIITRNVMSYFPGYDSELTAEMDKVWYEYLRFRKYNPNPETPYQLSEYASFSVIAAPELLPHKEELTKRTYEKLRTIFKRVGVPRREIIADRAPLPLAMMRGASTAFLDEFWEELVSACHKSYPFPDVFLSSLGFAYDEACVREEKKQRYGSLFLRDKKMRERESIDFWPVEDPANLEARRKAIGLKPMAEFFRGFDVEYSVEKQINYQGFPEGFTVHYSPHSAYWINEQRPVTVISAPSKSRIKD